MNNDRSIFFVLCQFRSGLEWVARDPANMSRKETLIDIRSGELPTVLQVLECNPVERICSDVTDDEDFAEAIYYAEHREELVA